MLQNCKKCYPLLMMLGVLAACQDRPSRLDPAQGEYLPSREDSVRIALEGQAVTDYSALTATLRPPSTVAHGQPVEFELVVQNVSDRPVWLETGDSTYAFDFIVTNRDGSEIWSRLHSMRGDPIPAILRRRVIAPGDSVRYQGTWNQRSDSGRKVNPGTYWVQGTLNTHEDRSDSVDMRTATKSFIIVP
jgi:hypothetical protein